MKKVKIFSSSADSELVDSILERKIEEWMNEKGNIEINDISSNSNRYGWMIVITYTESDSLR